MSNNGFGTIAGIVIGIICLVALFFIGKGLWDGIIWLFNSYADLLHIM